MNRIATFSGFNQSIVDFARMQQQMTELQRETAQNTKAADLQGYGAAAGQVVSTQSVIALTQARADAAGALDARFAATDVALDSAADAAEVLRQTILTAVGQDNGTAVVSALSNAFAAIKAAFNQTYNGEALFGGERTNAEPINVASLAALSAAPSTASIFNVSSRTKTADLGAGAFSLGATASTIGSGLFDAMRSIQQLLDANGGTLPNPLTDAQKTSLTTLAAQLATGRATVVQAQGSNGALQTSVATQATQLSAKVDSYKKVLGDQTGIDLAEVSAQLVQLQTQYQASASVFNSLKSMTLLSFLTTSAP